VLLHCVHAFTAFYLGTSMRKTEGPDTFTITLPVPPSTNALYFNRKTGGRAKTNKYKAWIQQAEGVLLEHVWKGVRFGKEPVRIRVIPPFNGRRDLDNCLKAIGDVLVSSQMLSSDRMSTIQEITVEAGARDQKGCIVTIARIQARTVDGDSNPLPQPSKVL
jgi:Holliday junction resolvase RusA-like endonuclease